MGEQLSENWRKMVYMLLWHPVYAHCPVCLEERDCQLRTVRLTDGSELRDLCCDLCPREDATRKLVSAAELARERIVYGDAPLERHIGEKAMRMLSPHDLATIEERKENERQLSALRERKRKLLAVPGTPRPLPGPEHQRHYQLPRSDFYPRIVRGEDRRRRRNWVARAIDAIISAITRRQSKSGH